MTIKLSKIQIKELAIQYNELKKEEDRLKEERKIEKEHQKYLDLFYDRMVSVGIQMPKHDIIESSAENNVERQMTGLELILRDILVELIQFRIPTDKGLDVYYDISILKHKYPTIYSEIINLYTTIETQLKKIV